MYKLKKVVKLKKIKYPTPKIFLYFIFICENTILKSLLLAEASSTLLYFKGNVRRQPNKNSGTAEKVTEYIPTQKSSITSSSLDWSYFYDSGQRLKKKATIDTSSRIAKKRIINLIDLGEKMAVFDIIFTGIQLDAIYFLADKMKPIKQLRFSNTDEYLFNLLQTLSNLDFFKWTSSLLSSLFDIIFLLLHVLANLLNVGDDFYYFQLIFINLYFLGV